MKRVWRWPLWAKVGALASTVVAFVVVSALSGIIGNRADVFVDWAFPFLFRQLSLPVWGLLLVALMGGCLGISATLFLRRDQISAPSEALAAANTDLAEIGAAVTEPTPQAQAATELDVVLQQITKRNPAALPQILGRLRYIFDRLGNDEDAAWCQAELNGYTPETTPEYRRVEVTIKWGGAGVTSMNTFTGEVSSPPDRTEIRPLNERVEDLLRMSQRETRTLTGNKQRGLMGTWWERVEVRPEAVHAVLGRIIDECYRRALAATKTLETAP